MLGPAEFEPRAVCGRCRRPESVCYCKHLTSIETATRIVLLQHPRERDMAIGTARMASLCLPNAELHVGVRWQGSSALARALSDPARPAALLYPGEDAIDVGTHPPPGPITLVVVDGTWWQAKKLVRENPELAALPRYTFKAPTPSEYRIRKEPNEAYVSTIEALVHVLGALEGDPERFRALLLPFRAMIDAQIACEKLVGSGRVRHPRKQKPYKPRVPTHLGEHRNDLVCVVGEANAWPYTCPERLATLPDELVHWVAHRLSTGETFDFVVAPKNLLAPKTASYVELSAEELAAGGTMTELFERWRAFIRDTDVVCSWGRYATALFVAAGGYLPDTRFDLRQVARVFTSGKVGTLEGFVTSTGQEPTTLGVGRGGMRVAQIAAVARHLTSPP